MSIHDSAGDFFTIIRNASSARKKTCRAHYSKLRAGVAKVLAEKGYIRSFQKNELNGCQYLELELKYVDDEPAIVGIQRYSRPGRRLYSGYQDVPSVLSGLGISILTTSKGIVTDREAREQKLGGEILCKVW